MNYPNEENLKEVFEKFLEPKEAEQAAEDMARGERILREHPAAKADDELIAGIKMKISGVLHRKTVAFRRIVYKTAVVAAAVILLAAIGTRLFEKGGESGKAAASIIDGVIWESEGLAADDVDLAILAAEIEQIEDEVLALQLGEDGGNGSKAVTELEIELIEINNDFWKG
jgi:hypothetical protein